VLRHPSTMAVENCARDEGDMCRDGRYTERGIKELDEYASEVWTVPARFAVKEAPHPGSSGY
jgi:hypothetical protein